ncbi:hypothetical protein ACFL4T_03685, partial [candidate division KSB1 bacterium]
YGYLKHMEGLYSYKLYKAGDRKHKELLNKAIISMKEALQFVEEETNPVKYAQINYDIGNAYFTGGRIIECLPFYEEALKFISQEKEQKKYADIHYRLGLAFFLHPRVKLEEAIIHYKEAIKVYTPNTYPK